ncbi:MAG: hypothetical protein NZO58_01910 [Gemmataceae bacterium]|nr:hypothetical protein [Gemmataceae bacterium]
MFAVLEIADYLILVLMFLLFATTSSYAGLRPRERARLFRLERKLDLVLQHLRIDVDQLCWLSDQVKALADRGDKIAAIKAHRAETGLGLRDAKEDVEAYLAGQVHAASKQPTAQ